MSYTKASGARFASLLAERILLLDGAMGTMVQTYGLEEADYRGERFVDHHKELKGNNDLLSLTQPHIIQAIHQAYLDAGSDIIETNSFTANRTSQQDYALQHLVYEINHQAARLAGEALADFQSAAKPRFVAGVLGPINRSASTVTDVNDPGFRNISFDELVCDYTEALEGLIDGGIDIILVETVFDTLNCKAALFAIAQYFAGNQSCFSFLRILVNL